MESLDPLTKEISETLDVFEKNLDLLDEFGYRLAPEQIQEYVPFLNYVLNYGGRDIEDRARALLGRLEKMKKASYRRWLPLMIFVAMIGLNFWLFRRIGGVNYFVWYLKNGALIGIAISFLALTWEGLKSRKYLLSSHPGEYLAGCATLCAVFYTSVATFLDGPLRKIPTNDSEPRAVLSSWDDLIGNLMTLLMMVATLGWLLVVAPLNYFITLITGSLARQELRGSVLRAVVKGGEKSEAVTSQPAAAEIPTNAVDVSLTRNPFAITQALTAMVLWIANLTYERLA